MQELLQRQQSAYDIQLRRLEEELEYRGAQLFDAGEMTAEARATEAYLRSQLEVSLCLLSHLPCKC